MGRELRERRSRDVKFSVTCLTLNFLFGFMRLPILIVYYVYTSGIPVDYNGLYFSVFLNYVDFSIGFVVYFISNKMFRNELFRLIGLRGSSSVSTTGGGGGGGANTRSNIRVTTQV